MSELGDTSPYDATGIYTDPDLSQAQRRANKRRVEAFLSSDGKTHASLREAVVHDIQNLLEPIDEVGMLSTRLIAGHIVEQPLRSQLLDLLKELG